MDESPHDECIRHLNSGLVDRYYVFAVSSVFIIFFVQTYSLMTAVAQHDDKGIKTPSILFVVSLPSYGFGCFAFEKMYFIPDTDYLGTMLWATIFSFLVKLVLPSHDQDTNRNVMLVSNIIGAAYGLIVFLVYVKIMRSINQEKGKDKFRRYAMWDKDSVAGQLTTDRRREERLDWNVRQRDEQSTGEV